MDNLSKSKNIVILKQDKRRGFVILDKYSKKMYDIIKYRSFQKVTTDPTAVTERKRQKVLRKIKSKFSEQE